MVLNLWHEPLLSLELLFLLMYCSRYDSTPKFSPTLKLKKEVMGVRFLYLVLVVLGIQRETVAMLCHICFISNNLIYLTGVSGPYVAYFHCSIILDWLLQGYHCKRTFWLLNERQGPMTQPNLTHLFSC